MSGFRVAWSIFFALVKTRFAGPIRLPMLALVGAGRSNCGTGSMERTDNAEAMPSGCGPCATCIRSVGATNSAWDWCTGGGHGNGGLRLVNSVTTATSAGRSIVAVALAVSITEAFFLPLLSKDIDGCGGAGFCGACCGKAGPGIPLGMDDVLGVGLGKFSLGPGTAGVSAGGMAGCCLLDFNRSCSIQKRSSSFLTP